MRGLFHKEMAKQKFYNSFLVTKTANLPIKPQKIS